MLQARINAPEAALADAGEQATEQTARIAAQEARIAAREAALTHLDGLYREAMKNVGGAKHVS